MPESSNETSRMEAISKHVEVGHLKSYRMLQVFSSDKKLEANGNS